MGGILLFLSGALWTSYFWMCTGKEALPANMTVPTLIVFVSALVTLISGIGLLNKKEENINDEEE